MNFPRPGAVNRFLSGVRWSLRSPPFLEAFIGNTFATTSMLKTGKRNTFQKPNSTVVVWGEKTSRKIKDSFYVNCRLQIDSAAFLGVTETNILHELGFMENNKIGGD